MSTDYDDFESGPRARGDRPGPAPVNGPAVAALILGILSLGCLFITGLPAIICGFIGISKAGRIGKGKGMAVTGLLLGAFGTVVLTSAAVFVMFYSVGKVRDAAGQAQVKNNLKQINLATQGYDIANRRLPSPYVPDSSDLRAKPIENPSKRIGWRYIILPYIEQGATFHKYQSTSKQDWDSPANRPMASVLIRPYADPQSTDPDTRYRVFVGSGALYQDDMPPNTTVSIDSISEMDGTSNTFFAVEAGDKVPWSQYNELRYAKDAPLPALGRPNTDTFLASMMDGSIRTIRKDADPAVLKKLITPDGDETIDFDELD